MYYLDLFGVAVFAITGSLAAGRKQMDLLVVVVLASVTALGGGTIRDLVLGARPIFWVSAPIYVLLTIVIAILIFFLVRVRKRKEVVRKIAPATTIKYNQYSERKDTTNPQ